MPSRLNLPKKLGKGREDKDDDGPLLLANRTQTTDIKADATCTEAEIRYPTDLDFIKDRAN